MDLEDAWNSALKRTEIIRTRVQNLHTFNETRVPYIFLAESSINVGDTIVRKGEVVVEKPSLFIPPNIPQFEGFEFEQQENFAEDSVINFLLVRGISLPSLRYNNKISSLDVHEGRLVEAIKHYEKLLQQKENVTSGLITGPEDAWQFSVLIFICSQITKNLETDMKKLLDDYKKKNK